MTDRLDEVLDTGTGLTLRQLTSVVECDHAVYVLERDIDNIVAQIAKAEECPETVRPGWRTRAQSAIRWKRRSIKAIREHAGTLRTGVAAPYTRDDRRRVILDTIRTEMGDGEFDRLVGIAKGRHPGLLVGEAWP